MKRAYKYIKVITSDSEDVIASTVAKLYIHNFSNVGIISHDDQTTKDVVIYPGTRDNLEDVVESIILDGFYDATLVPDDTKK